jgi:Tol biopolymer transport system component
MGRKRGVWLLIAVSIVGVVFGGLLGGCGGSDEGEPEPNGMSLLPETAEILFLSNQDTGSECQEIYSMDAEGGNVTRITTTGEQHFIFGIDSSGRYIVATRGSELGKGLWLLDLETGEETALTGAEDLAEGRTFSPDGEWIVFWMVPSGGAYSDIYKIRRDGTGMTNLTETENAHEWDPAWSNGGDEIAFAYNDLNPNRCVLKAMDTDGGKVRTIYDAQDTVPVPDRFPAGVFDPSWSPDDEWILVDKCVQFTGEGENGTAGVWHIVKVKADGSEAIDLSEAGGHADRGEYLPSFSPDGNTIVFSARYGPEDPAQTSLNIFTMDKDGGSLEQLTDTAFWDEFAIWV